LFIGNFFLLSPSPPKMSSPSNQNNNGVKVASNVAASPMQQQRKSGGVYVAVPFLDGLSSAPAAALPTLLPMHAQGSRRHSVNGGGGGNIDPARYKTSLCHHFQLTRTCPFGQRCVFAHGEWELRNLPSTKSPNTTTKALSPAATGGMMTSAITPTVCSCPSCMQYYNSTTVSTHSTAAPGGTAPSYAGGYDSVVSSIGGDYSFSFNGYDDMLLPPPVEYGSIMHPSSAQSQPWNT
jgi:hypothetical protein